MEVPENLTEAMMDCHEQPGNSSDKKNPVGDNDDKVSIL
jgi:hypothetical protein